jgi:hypothetical protein
MRMRPCCRRAGSEVKPYVATVEYNVDYRDLLSVAQLKIVQLAREANLIKLRAAQRTNRVRYQALGGSFRRRAADGDRHGAAKASGLVSVPAAPAGCGSSRVR